MSNDLGRAFLENVNTNIDGCIAKITHCTNQLTDEQIWFRPIESMNSIGNILLHLCGNMTQWIINGVQQKPDTRDRPKEFSERGPIAKAELLRNLNATVAEAKQVVVNVAADELLQPRRVQSYQETVLSAITHSSYHLAGHTQEIIYITRMQLGDEYKFSWKPTTPEQGAPGKGD